MPNKTDGIQKVNEKLTELYSEKDIENERNAVEKIIFQLYGEENFTKEKEILTKLYSKSEE